MEQNNKKSKTGSFFSLIKNLFMLLLFLQFAPMIIKNIKTYLEDTVTPKTQVGYLTVKGPIIDSSFYIKKINEFKKTPDIKALLIKINSPGGYSGSCHAIFNELKRFKKDKPIIALVENAAASGAYYIAAAANKIIASPLSLVGSIGVFMELPNIKNLLESWKVHFKYVQTGTYKTTGSMVKDLSPQELAYLQKLSDDQYNQFVKDVAENRNLSIKNHRLWADGKAFTGRQALSLKLIDQFGSFNDALDEVKKLIKVEGEVKLVHPPRTGGLMRLLVGDEEHGQQSSSMSGKVATFLSQVCEKFTLQQANKQTSLT